MAYNDTRAYVNFTLAAQNIVSTASGQLVAGATVALLPTSEPTFITSVGGVASATPSNPPGTAQFFVVVGTSTTTGAKTVAYAQSSGSSGMSTFVPPVPLGAGAAFTVGLIAVSTASSTQTAAATTGIVGLAPQFV